MGAQERTIEVQNTGFIKFVFIGSLQLYFKALIGSQHLQSGHSRPRILRSLNHCVTILAAKDEDPTRFHCSCIYLQTDIEDDIIIAWFTFLMTNTHI